MRAGRWLGVLALLAVLAWLGASLAVARRLTSRARPVHPEPLPDLTWARASEHRLRTEDGEELGAWLLLPPDAAGADVGARRGAFAEPPRTRVVVLHGNGGSRSGALGEARVLVELGCEVLAVTHRAHGDSSGEHNDFGRAAAQDLLAAVDFLERRGPGPIAVRGSSLGAAAALFAAARLEGRVAGYLLECPYATLRRAVRDRLAMRLPAPLVPLALTGLELVAPAAGIDLAASAPIERVADVPAGVPLVVLAGAGDRHAPLEEVQRLCAAARVPCEPLVFARAGHEGLRAAEPRHYRDVVAAWLGAIAETAER